MKGYVDANITAINNSLAGANATMVTSVSGTAPVTSSGGTTPAISMAAATASVNGYMTSTYASKLDGIAAGATNVTNTNQLTNGAAFVTASVTLTTAAQTNITSVGTLTSLTLSGTLKRSAAGIGHLEGSYPSVETSSTPGVIYTIGGTYQPTASTLGTMYGIGYTYVGTDQFSLTTNTGAPTNNWGMYVASGGVARIFLDSDNGVVYATANKAKYADLAEKYTSDKTYVSGTVVVFGGEKEITISTFSHDTAVAGVISSDPAYLMNNMIDGLPVALQGRVPCRVQGPINKGDCVVSSDTPGVAQRLDRVQYLPGCVIGKALEDITEDRIVTIEVVVGRV
jgi:hypothetical protein